MNLVRSMCLTALLSPVVIAITVQNTILVIARDAYGASTATWGLQGYGIPYQTLLVPSTGTALPALNSSTTSGSFGGIVVVSEVSYQYGSSFSSALTASQWQDLYNYQTAFRVRMVRLDAFPNADSGTTTAIAGAGCCAAGVGQLVSISNTAAFPTANLKTNAGVTTEGLWHYPATITNTSVATEVAQFAPAGSFTTKTTAAVINNFGTRQQMVWFISWATDWSPTSNYLQHAWIHWVTRGIFVGSRKIYLNTQVDDMHLESDIYQPAGNTFRIRTSDLNAHKSWLTGINSRLPGGSSYFMELAHNGNGDIEYAADTSQGAARCIPDNAVEYDSPPDTPLEFQKPLGTGTDLWDPEWVKYGWTLQCALLDPIASWFNQAANRDVFAHLSHTFTHEELNNATYRDANLEMQFNIAWLKQIGIWNGNKFSPSGLVPPAITGLHNGDAIKAWRDNGITYVVGDNTRPVLRNANPRWPLTTTVAGNGYAGLIIIPRWATTIYYNCDLPACTLAEWINTSGGSGDFNALLDNARFTNTRYLLGLQPDPFMFHQANLRQGDTPTFTVGSQTGKLSLIQIWVETITQEMTRLTNWPIKSLKHDDIGALFTSRQTRDNCNPNLSYTYSLDSKFITSVTLTANGNNCAVPIPVTFSGTASTTSGGTTQDKVGSEPLIINAKLSGSPISFTLGTPVPV
ncbi:hypothetical protein GE09DRAFT_1115011 [Coniochaeta sp. 2T2.1]|nr:hypothetical protein GE09DRAFT_1115011 [Coniochaeta sp. 2T2.1]